MKNFWMKEILLMSEDIIRNQIKKLLKQKRNILKKLSFIRNQIKKCLKPLHEHNIKLSFEEYENIPVIVASNLPSNYESVLSSIIGILEKFDVSKEVDEDKNVFRFINLPSQYVGDIKFCIDEYNLGRI